MSTLPRADSIGNPARLDEPRTLVFTRWGETKRVTTDLYLDHVAESFASGDWELDDVLPVNFLSGPLPVVDDCSPFYGASLDWSPTGSSPWTIYSYHATIQEAQEAFGNLFGKDSDPAHWSIRCSHENTEGGAS